MASDIRHEITHKQLSLLFLDSRRPYFNIEYVYIIHQTRLDSQPPPSYENQAKNAIPDQTIELNEN